MMQILERAGLLLSGIPLECRRGFIDIHGSGKPVIALHTEFDATRGCSQAPVVAEPTPIVDGAPGHTEGHNVNGAVMIGAALAIKKTIDEFGVKGTLKVFGAPAEEQLVSRPYFVAMAISKMSMWRCMIILAKSLAPSMVCDNTR